MKKGIIITVIIIGILMLFLAYYGKKIQTILSLKKIKNIPLYVMVYYGDYGFDKYLKVGATNDTNMENTVFKLLLTKSGSSQNIKNFACTVFSAQKTNKQWLFGRNFDYEYGTGLLLFTKPSKGFASVSMVNLDFLDYKTNRAPNATLSDSIRLLALPYVPVDGMNEKGVGVAILKVPFSEPGFHKNKVTLNDTALIRLILDYAGDVNEAINLMKKYNVYFSEGETCHFFITDRSGKSAVVEYVNGNIVVIPKEKAKIWQVTSNFIMTECSRKNQGEGKDRYLAAEKDLKKSNGIVTEAIAMNILRDAKMIEDEARTRWSLVYNLSDGNISIVMAMQYQNPPLLFSLKMSE